jgi:hypothetical protein
MGKNNQRTETTIKCKVSLGMFEDERGVVIDLPSGRKVSCMADKSQVIVTNDPEPGEEVGGRVKVRFLGFDNNSAIVDLPQSGFGNGLRVRVPRSFVEE